MAGRKAWVVTLALLLASAIAIAAAPAQPSQDAARKPGAAEPESNEKVVADFLNRKEKAERAQRAILLGLRTSLDQKREEFERARKRFDQARGVYAEIVGPLGSQGFMNPEDPRLPYAFEMRRTGPESIGGGDYRRSPSRPSVPIHP